MTRFAPVAPLPLLQSLWNHDQNQHMHHGSYHLLLAHDIIASIHNRNEYRAHFEKVRDWFQDCTIIMDNSIVELGDAVDMWLVAAAAEVVHADVMVLPDVMGSGKRSLKLFNDTISKGLPRGNYQYMAVPQGPTISDFATCLEEYSQHEYITWIGIPRIATQQLGSRRQLIQMATMIKPEWRLHLLGFSDNVVDDMLCAAAGVCEGIDSAVPVRAGQRNIPFCLAESDYGKRGDYWESKKHTLQALKNIKYVRDLIGETES